MSRKKIILIVSAVVVVGGGIAAYMWANQDREVTKEDLDKAEEVANDDEMLKLIDGAIEDGKNGPEPDPLPVDSSDMGGDTSAMPVDTATAVQ